MASYGFLWTPMDSYGFLWTSMDFRSKSVSVTISYQNDDCRAELSNGGFLISDSTLVQHRCSMVVT